MCATCGVDIQVPFPPDGKRPTFCKDCLKDYQRATAKVRESVPARSGVTPSGSDSHDPASSIRHGTGAPEEERPSRKREMQAVTYTPTEVPMSLTQMQHIQPKKFQPLREKRPVELGEVRSLIRTIRPSSRTIGDDDD
jgi:CxxC-x17-CxxC domain-containing protein